MSQPTGDGPGTFSASTGLTPDLSAPAQPDAAAAPAPVAPAQPAYAAAPARQGPSTAHKVARGASVVISTIWGIVMIVLGIALFASPAPFWMPLLVLVYGVYLVWPSRRGKWLIY